MSYQPLQPEDLTALGPDATLAGPSDIAVLAAQLGRVPRGVRGVGARCPAGHPLVVITNPTLEDGTPFPTLFYLTEPGLTKACSRLEAGQEMVRYNEALAEDPELAAQYREAHADYLRRRRILGEVDALADITAGGMPSRVKCLHALVAHSLAAGPGVNPIGDRTLAVLEENGWWSQGACTCEA